MTKLSHLDIESLPHYHKKTAKEWSAACPQCGGKDRFQFWPDTGNYWCRQCDLKGYILEADQHLMTQEQREAWKRAEEARRQKETEVRLAAIDRLQRIADKVSLYQSQVGQALAYWQAQGLTPPTINQYRLGYCPRCPTEPESPSYTIPYFQAGRLVNLRHRLQHPNGHGKYRPEFAGLSNQLFNADTLIPSDEIPFGILEPGETLVVEGEIKTMVLEQRGFKAVGIPGATAWQDEWGKLFEGIKKAYIMLDPGANGHAWRVGAGLKGWGLEAVVCTVPFKPDDMFVLYGANTQDFMGFLRQGRAVP